MKFQSFYPLFEQTCRNKIYVFSDFLNKEATFPHFRFLFKHLYITHVLHYILRFLLSKVPVIPQL